MVKNPGPSLAFIAALLFTLSVNGVIPFIAAPTLGQALWTTGFALSFLNDSIFSIYARNFGAPDPAAISFGLAGAWPSALFIKAGLHPVDAYSLMGALWFSIAFVSACRIGRYFSVHPLLATLGAVSWMTMPVIWGHSSYSMLSIGIALLPFYFLAAFHLLAPRTTENAPGKVTMARQLCCYSAVCLVAVFMDGYSFMMFAAGSSLLGAILFVGDPESRRRLASFSFPVHVFGLGFAALLYALYVGQFQFKEAPIDFFRAWGVDVSFLLIPTRGMHWLADFIGWSSFRSNDIYFGDSSVWTTTFALPVILGSIWAFAHGAVRKKIAVGLAVLVVFGFYMALGPSLKVNSVKPAGEHAGPNMAEKYALAPTGSALLSENLPGFKDMRASYRWAALGVFSAWALVLLAMSGRGRKSVIGIAAAVMAVIAVANLPHLPRHLQAAVHNREMFLDVESALVEEMAEVVLPHEKVAFLPWRNDFLVNYIASRMNAVAFNIGGDKNLAAARAHWPKTMRRFPMARVDEGFARRILLLLTRNEADVVILPYIDMQWAAHSWPPPVEFRIQLLPVLADLESSGAVNLEERKFYAAVRLKPELESEAKKGILEATINERQGMNN